MHKLEIWSDKTLHFTWKLHSTRKCVFYINIPKQYKFSICLCYWSFILMFQCWKCRGIWWYNSNTLLKVFTFHSQIIYMLCIYMYYLKPVLGNAGGASAGIRMWYWCSVWIGLQSISFLYPFYVKVWKNNALTNVQQAYFRHVHVCTRHDRAIKSSLRYPRINLQTQEPICNIELMQLIQWIG